MNRKSRTAACRSPEQTRPRLLIEYRAPAAAACSHAAAGSTHHARMRSDQKPPPPGGPRFGQPGRPTREWSGRLAQTRGQDRQDYVQHGRGRPSVGETPANTVDVFLASAAPPARDSGCPPNRVNPSMVTAAVAQHRERPLPDPQAIDRAACLDNLAGGFEPRGERELRLHLIGAADHQAVGEVDARGADPEAYLVLLEVRALGLFEPQHIGSAPFPATDRLHFLLLAIHPSLAPTISWRSDSPGIAGTSRS